MLWDKEKIKDILPQREPFLFIDEVVEIEGTTRVVAAKDIRADEYYFKGHFPGKPILPGVLIIEAMAQTSIILYALCKPEIAKAHPNYYLAKTQAEFMHPVVPGDRLLIEARVVRVLDNAGIIETFARVHEKLVAKATLSFGVKKDG
jgi:3-hydroxyacyl-[acyl-carrier-protein] dehydratase